MPADTNKPPMLYIPDQPTPDPVPQFYKLKDGRTFTSSKTPDHPDMQAWMAEQGIKPEDVAETHPHTFTDDPTIQALSGGGKAFATGVGKGTGNMVDLLNPMPTSIGAEPDLRKTGGVPPATLNSHRPTTSEKIGDLAGGYHEANGRVEKIIEGAGEGLAGGMAGPGSLAAKALVYGAIPGAASEAAGQATEGIKTPEWSWLPDALKGKDISPAARMLAAVFSPMAARKTIITPNTVTDQARLDAARTAKQNGISITTGQLTKNPTQINRELEAEPEFNNRQSGQYMQAVTRPAGEATRDVTAGAPGSYVPRVMDQASTNLGNVAARNSINLAHTPQTLTDLSAIFKANPQAATPVRNLMYQTLGRRTLFPSHTMSGQDYQHLRSALHSAAANESPVMANALRNTADVLDTAMGDSIGRTNPADAGMFHAARRQYANALTMEHAAGNAGAGITRFTPDQIKASTKAVQGARPYLRGQTENSEVNEAMGKFDPLKKTNAPPPETASALLGLAGMTSAGLGAHFGYGAPWEHAGLFSLVGGEAGNLAGKLNLARGAVNKATLPLVMNPAVQAWGKNQFAPKYTHEGLPWPLGTNPNKNSMLIRALLENQRQEQQ